MPILLHYAMAQSHETEDNAVEAEEATYEQALAAVRESLDQGDEYTMPTLPTTAKSLRFWEFNAEKWTAFAIAWGHNPKIGASDFGEDSGRLLEIDGTAYEIVVLGEDDEGW